MNYITASYKLLEIIKSGESNVSATDFIIYLTY